MQSIELAAAKLTPTSSLASFSLEPGISAAIDYVTHLSLTLASPPPTPPQHEFQRTVFAGHSWGTVPAILPRRSRGSRPPWPTSAWN